jgi:enoyl-[acyl-carrier-protein] reductase (NADH)
MTFAELTPGQLRRDPLPLRGRVAVVTGVSRRAGIGYAIAAGWPRRAPACTFTTTRGTIATSRGAPIPAAPRP